MSKPIEIGNLGGNTLQLVLSDPDREAGDNESKVRVRINDSGITWLEKHSKSTARIRVSRDLSWHAIRVFATLSEADLQRVLRQFNEAETAPWEKLREGHPHDRNQPAARRRPGGRPRRR